MKPVRIRSPRKHHGFQPGSEAVKIHQPEVHIEHLSESRLRPCMNPKILGLCLGPEPQPATTSAVAKYLKLLIQTFTYMSAAD